MGHELGLDAQPRLLPIVLGLREDRLGLGLHLFATILDLFRGASSRRSPWTLALRRTGSPGPRRRGGSLRTAGGRRASVAPTSSSVSPRAVLGVRGAGIRGGELGLEHCDLLASLLLRRGDLGLHPLGGLGLHGFELSLQPRHRLPAGGIDTTVTIGQLCDLLGLGAHTRGEACDRRVDLVLVVAAERARERRVRRGVPRGTC